VTFREARLRAALGKARGQALRLALNLEMLWWCGEEGFCRRLLGSARALFRRNGAGAAISFAERAYRDAAATTAYRDAATLARWILGARPVQLHIRHLQDCRGDPQAAEVLVCSGSAAKAASKNLRLGLGRESSHPLRMLSLRARRRARPDQPIVVSRSYTARTDPILSRQMLLKLRPAQPF
jgi:hypothetical protein